MPRPKRVQPPPAPELPEIIDPPEPTELDEEVMSLFSPDPPAKAVKPKATPSETQEAKAARLASIEEKRSDLISMVAGGETEKVGRTAVFLRKASPAVIEKLFEEAEAVETRQISDYVTRSTVGVGGVLLEGAGLIESGDKLSDEIMANPIFKKSLRRTTCLLPDLYGMEGFLVAGVITLRHIASRRIAARVEGLATVEEEPAEAVEEQPPPVTEKPPGFSADPPPAPVSRPYWE